MASRSSEIVLVLLLIVIVGFVRIYYGGSQGLMVVWKDHFTYADTLVSLGDVLNAPRADLERDHAAVLNQLEEMGLYADVSGEKPPRRWTGSKIRSKHQPAPVEDKSRANVDSQALIPSTTESKTK